MMKNICKCVLGVTIAITVALGTVVVAQAGYNTADIYEPAIGFQPFDFEDNPSPPKRLL